MGWTSRVGRPCRYVIGFDQGPKTCGVKTQNLMEQVAEVGGRLTREKIPICAYHSQYSKPPAEWPEH